MPTTRVTFSGRAASVKVSIASLKRAASARMGVMSLKMMPGLGKSGTSRMAARKRAAGWVFVMGRGFWQKGRRMESQGTEWLAEIVGGGRVQLRRWVQRAPRLAG